ncbi:MAG: hypothetical protein IPM46_00505 [Flavobacteriales bacterium]|nr:hypothetical protein [Flavobacteriales bacterium]
MKGSFCVLLSALLVTSCNQAAREQAAQQRKPLIPAQGRTTRITSVNAPETSTLAPEIIVSAAPFAPVDGEPIAHTRTFTTDDGLPMDDIPCATRAPNGMLWFGTNGAGVSRYDGRSFVNFTMAQGLPDNTILSIAAARNGDIWIGTSTGGLCRYDGHRFSTYNVPGAAGLSKGFSCIREGPDGVWCGTRGHGLVRIADGHHDVWPVVHSQGKDHVRDIAFAHGMMWVSTYAGLARFDGRTFHEVKDAEGRALSDVESMAVTADGTLWLGRVSGGVTRMTMQNSTPQLMHEPLLPGEPVKVSQLSTDDDALWIASTTHGALRYAPSSDGLPSVRAFGIAHGLPTDELLSVVLGARGDAWFGTRGAGVVHHRGPAFANYRGIKPISMAEDSQGTLWVGTTESLARMDERGLHVQQESFGDRGWNYSVSIDPQGRVGFGRNMAEPDKAGISWFDGHNYHVMRTAEARGHTDVFWTMHDRLGRLWVGGRHGLERWAGGTRNTWSTAQGLGSHLVLFIAEDSDGAIWVGTDGGGASRMAGDSISTWTTNEGLPNNVVWSVVEEARGTRWISTLAGICRYDGRSFITFTTQDGLPDDNINQALLARDGKALFVGTLNGFAVITGWKDALGNVQPFDALDGLPNDSVVRYAPVVEVYNSATGFPVKDVQTAERTLFEDRDGVLWIATGSNKSGLVRFDRKAMQHDAEPVRMELLSVSLHNEPTCWHALDASADSTVIAQQEAINFGAARATESRERDRDRFGGISFNGISPHFPVPQDLVLDYRNNRMAFSFVGIEPSRPELVEYQWLLEGYDNDWNAPSRNTNASFGNIREGDYTFKVRAKSPDGVWSAPLEYRFSVLPPVHRTWWALIVYVILIAGAITMVIRRRTAALQAQKARLERTVEERTVELRSKKEEADEQRQRAELSEKAKERFLANMSHEIRTPMNAIMGMSEILKERPHSPEQEKYLGAIHQSSENLLVIINDILDLTKIDAGRVEFESVPFDVRTVIGNVQDIMRFKADQKSIGVEVAIAEDVPTQLIGDPTRLNQIVMNLAGNAVKFTERGSVTIGVHRSADPLGRTDWIALVIDVIDTGIGIPEDRIGRIFEEFTQAYSDTTRKYGGTGLGLTISKRLTELQGGRIKVKSERDKGSTFTVTIPYIKP